MHTGRGLCGGGLALSCRARRGMSGKAHSSRSGVSAPKQPGDVVVHLAHVACALMVRVVWRGRIARGSVMGGICASCGFVSPPPPLKEGRRKGNRSAPARGGPPHSTAVPLCRTVRDAARRAPRHEGCSRAQIPNQSCGQWASGLRILRTR